MDFGIELPIVFGALIEAVVYYVDRLAVKRVLDWRLVASLVFGVIIAVVFKQDIFAGAGFVATVPYVAYVLTGIVYGRVANLAHGLLGKLGANLVQ